MRILILLIFFTSCIEQDASIFNETTVPLSGSDQVETTKMNTPLQFSYKIEQTEEIDTSITIVEKPLNGSLTNCETDVESSINCTYTPNQGFVGDDSITFKARAGDFLSSKESILKILVIEDKNPITYAPVIGENQNYSSQVNKPLFITVSTASDQDATATDRLTYQIVNAPKHGILKDCFSVLGDKNCTYQPNTNFTGSDSFTYKVVDKDGNSSSSATISIKTILNCTNVTRLGIYLDKNKNEIADEDESLGQINSYVGNESAAANYNYYSWSAHPKVGPTPSGYAGNVFLYEGVDGLTLNMFFNVDDGGSTDNQVEWEIYTSNNNMSDNVLLSDDNLELKKTSATSEEKIKETMAASSMGLQTDNISMHQTYTGKWQYWSNTDGGVIGPFTGRDFEIKIKMIKKGDVKDVKFHSAKAEDDVFLLSDANDDGTTFFLKYFDQEVCGY